MERGFYSNAAKIGVSVIRGPEIDEISREFNHILHVMAQHGEDEFNLERFWSIESLGISPHYDGPENDFLSSYQATSISRDTDSAYNAKFHWKDEHPLSPLTFRSARNAHVPQPADSARHQTY